MEELSLHILDIIENSVVADATLIEVSIIENVSEDIFSFEITDNGKGMEKEFLEKVLDPFTTKRKTRKVGLGLPLLKLACENTGGHLDITSKVGVGTKLNAYFSYSSIDRQPLGNIVETMHSVMTAYTNVDFVYYHRVNDNEITVDTREIKKILGDVSIGDINVSVWLLEFLRENEQELN